MGGSVNQDENCDECRDKWARYKLTATMAGGITQTYKVCHYPHCALDVIQHSILGCDWVRIEREDIP